MRKSRLSWSLQRRLIEHFVSGSTARTAASLVGVNKSTAAFYFHRLREIIALESEDASPLFGEIEVDESYFGGHRKGKRGRGVGLAMHGVDNDTLRPIDGFTRSEENTSELQSLR